MLGQIYPGEEVAVFDGPACAAGWVWWKVRSQKTGLVGWTSEGDQGTYWLIPLPLSITPSASGPQITNFAACLQPCAADGSNATRVIPGGATKLYVRWIYENIPVGAHYVRTWTLDGQEWVRYECSWPGPATGVDNIALREPDGLRSGNWQLMVSIDGAVVLREQVVASGNWTYWHPAGVFTTCYGTR